MSLFSKNKNVLNIQIDATELTDAQLRVLKSINSLFAHVLTTEEESEYFDGGAELMRMCASLIKQAHFVNDLKSDNIPYAEQVIEYSMDALQECVGNSKVVTYDN